MTARSSRGSLRSPDDGGPTADGRKKKNADEPGTDNEWIPIAGVLESCLYADDLAAAEQFYANVLGLEAFSRQPGRHVFFRCGPGVFLVFNPEVDWPGGGRSIYLRDPAGNSIELATPEIWGLE